MAVVPTMGGIGTAIDVAMPPAASTAAMRVSRPAGSASFAGGRRLRRRGQTCGDGEDQQGGNHG